MVALMFLVHTVKVRALVGQLGKTEFDIEGGFTSPYVLYMIKESEIKKLAKQAVKGSELFVVDVTVDNANNISVTIDGDHGVNISQIVEVSKYIENSFDREEEDFELFVSSYGIDKPITLLRQYQKYIEKPVELLLMDDTVKRGVVVSADTELLIINEEIIKKNRKSRKMLTGDPLEIPMSSIKEAKGIIVF